MDSAVVFSCSSSHRLKQTWFLCVISSHGLWGEESTLFLRVTSVSGKSSLLFAEAESLRDLSLTGSGFFFYFFFLVPSTFKDYGESGSTVCVPAAL